MCTPLELNMALNINALANVRQLFAQCQGQDSSFYTMLFNYILDLRANLHIAVLC